MNSRAKTTAFGRDCKGYGNQRPNRRRELHYAHRVDPSQPIARTSHAELTLTQVAESLPGTGELMSSVGHAFGMVWHAAQGGNWDLAAYFLRRTRSLLRGLAVVRPKYAAQVREFDQEWLEPAYAALIARDLAGFEREYARSIDQANAYHVDTGHPYIRWQTPLAPPDPSLDISGTEQPGSAGTIPR